MSKNRACSTIDWLLESVCHHQKQCRSQAAAECVSPCQKCRKKWLLGAEIAVFWITWQPVAHSIIFSCSLFDVFQFLLISCLEQRHPTDLYKCSNEFLSFQRYQNKLDLIVVSVYMLHTLSNEIKIKLFCVMTGLLQRMKYFFFLVTDIFWNWTNGINKPRSVLKRWSCWFVSDESPILVLSLHCGADWQIQW